MKAKSHVKFSVLIVAVVLLSALLAATLSSCIAINMQESRIKSNLEKAGAVVTYRRSFPMADEIKAGVVIKDILLAQKNYDPDNPESKEELYILVGVDDISGDWAEAQCKAYVKNNNLEHWDTYRHGETVLCGYYMLIRVARGY